MVNDLYVDEVAAAILVSIGLFIRRFRQIPVQDELTLPEISALSRLDRAGPATPGELAKVEQISPQAMGETLAALEKRGLGSVARTVSVTDAGKQALGNKRRARTEQLANDDRSTRKN